MQPQGVLLNDYTWMSTPANAQQVYAVLAARKMPIGGPYWTAAQLGLLNTWMTSGYNP